MSDYVARRNKNRRPTHPGVMLATTVLPALGRTKTEIAKLLGCRASRSMTFSQASSPSRRKPP